jgi:hypothetical protein
MKHVRQMLTELSHVFPFLAPLMALNAMPLQTTALQ